MLCEGDCALIGSAYSKRMRRRRTIDILIITLCALVTVLSLLGVRTLKVDSSTDAFIPQDDPVVRVNEEIEQRFGSIDVVVVNLTDERGFLTPENLQTLSILTEQIAMLEGVKQASSLANLKHMDISEDGLAVVPMYEQSIEQLNAYIESWPDLYEGTFISADRSSASIIIQPSVGYDQSKLLSGLRALLEPLGGMKASIVGLPMVTEQIRLSLLSDLAILAPIVAVIIIIILYLFLKDIVATLLCLVPLVFSSSLMLGLMSALHITFTMATMLVPVLLLIVGSAYTIHIFSHFFEEGAEVEHCLNHVVRKNARPIAAAAATTAFGFLSQLSSPLAPFRTFGLISFTGVAVCAVSSLVLLPALIRVVWMKPVNPKRTDHVQGRVWAQFGVVATRYGKPILLIALVVMFVILPLAYFNLDEGTNMLSFFRPSSALVQDTRAYNERMQGSFTFSVMLKPGTPALHPKTLSVVEDAIEVLEAHPLVGGVQSVLPFVKRMNQLLGPSDIQAAGNNDRSEPVFDFFSDTPIMESEEGETTLERATYGEGRYEIPTDPAQYGLEGEDELASLIAQYLLLYSGSLDAFIDDPLEPEHLLLTIQLKDSDTDLLKGISSLIPSLFPSDWQLEIGGGEAVSLALTELVTKSQIISIFSSFFAVWLLVLLTFKSAKLATLSLIPCLSALASVFSVMALLGIKLDIITSLLAALCIGVGVDYAIHLISAFQRNDMNLDRIMQTTGRAIAANAASVALGFLGLLFSRFVPIANMGLLFSIAMVSASLSALLVLGSIWVHYNNLLTRRNS